MFYFAVTSCWIASVVFSPAVSSPFGGRPQAAEGAVDLHIVTAQLLPFPVLLNLLVRLAPCRQTGERLRDRFSMSLKGEAEVGAMPRVSSLLAVTTPPPEVYAASSARWNASGIIGCSVP
jgi:hypothetical protein